MKDKTPFFLSNTIYKTVIGLLLLFLVASAFSFISINLSILTFFGFLPTLIAIALDNSNGKKVLWRIVGLFNILGSFSFFMKMLFNIHKIQQVSYIIISIPNTWFVIYSSCAFGVILYILIPRIAHYFIYTKKMDLLYKLKEGLDNIYQEWGEENIKIAISKNKLK